METVGTCKTCRYWKREEVGVYKDGDAYHYWPSVSDETDKPIKTQLTNYGACTCPKFKYYHLERVDVTTGEVLSIEADSLQYWDSEDYKAYFVTGEDFGCIHWSKREEE